MRRMLLILCLCFTCLTIFCDANAATSTAILHGKTGPVVSPPGFSFKAQEVEKILGRKLSFKEKIELKIFNLVGPRKLLKHYSPKKDSDKAQLALIFGIVGLAALVVPFLGLISLPCAIVALILGYQARRNEPNNKKARTAITLGWVTVGLFILALIIALVVLAAFAWY